MCREGLPGAECPGQVHQHLHTDAGGVVQVAAAGADHCHAQEPVDTRRGGEVREEGQQTCETGGQALAELVQGLRCLVQTSSVGHTHSRGWASEGKLRNIGNILEKLLHAFKTYCENSVLHKIHSVKVRVGIRRLN